jgi:hypothetical protein
MVTPTTGLLLGDLTLSSLLRRRGLTSTACPSDDPRAWMCSARLEPCLLDEG